MRTYTASQLSRLLNRAQDGKLCLWIARDTEADLFYCSGADPVTVDANLYLPREMSFDAFALGDPTETGQRISIDDADAVVRTAWYAERFSMKLATVTLLLRLPDEESWTEVYSVEWYVRYGLYGGAQFDVELHAAVGLRPRAGLVVGHRGIFPNAPEPGQSVRVGGYYASFPGGGGGSGGTNGRDPNQRIIRPSGRLTPINPWTPQPWE